MTVYPRKAGSFEDREIINVKGIRNMKQVFLYNLKPSITDEQYDAFLRKTKGPIISRRPSNLSFTMLRMKNLANGPHYYRYIGIVEFTNKADWEKDTAIPEFKAFQDEWAAMVEGEFVCLEGDEIATWMNWTKAGEKLNY
jgi:hypothetical protein